jgi:hypothetical protein
MRIELKVLLFFLSNLIISTLAYGWEFRIGGASDAPVTKGINQSSQNNSLKEPISANAAPELIDNSSKLDLKEMVKRSDNPNLSVVDDGNTFCMISAYSGHFSYVQINTFSTFGLGVCHAEDYYKLTPVSVKAQLATLGVDYYRIVMSGVYHPVMDLSNAYITEKYQSLGLLNFYQAGASTIRWLDLLKNPQYFKSYLKGNNYLPYKTIENIYYLWNPGTVIYELVDPSGNVYVMTAYTDALLQTLKLTSLSQLEKVLLLPDGWRFRSRILEKVFLIQSDARLNNSTVRVTDNYRNLYILIGGN